MYAFTLKLVDWIFLGCFLALLVILIVFLIVKKIEDKRTAKVLKEEFNNLNNADLAKLQNDPVSSHKETEEKSEEEVVLATPVSETETTETTTPVEEPMPEEVSTVETAEDTQLEEKVEEPVEEKVEVEPAEPEEAVEETTPEATEMAETTPTTEEIKPEEAPAEEETDEFSPLLEEPEEKKGRTYNGKYEVYQENNYYRYRLKASNGEILFVSEMYSSRLTVIKAIDNLKRNLVTGKTSIFADKKKNYKFKLTAANNRVMAISANYPTEKGAESALESFKHFALTNDIVDIELPAEQIDSQLVEITQIKEEDKKGGKFVIKKDINKEFSWELRANNGEILCQQGGYSSKGSVENAILAFKDNVSSGKFYLSKDKNNNYQFKLYSQSGRLANIGESYETSNAVYSVVTSILNFIDLAVIFDRSATPAKKPGAKKQSLKKAPARK